jgi:protein-S-isoprenylcysteine O-methyltransferase Ste14
MILRIFLFAGLVLHKLIWEIWKRKKSGSDKVILAVRPPAGLVKRMIKAGKVVVLLFFLVQTLFLDVLPMQNPNPAIRMIGIVFFILGLAMAVAGRIALGSNWRDLEDRQVLPDQLLVTNGLYRYVRHPIYAGDMLLIVGLELALQSWIVIFSLMIVAIVVRQTFVEEKLLEISFPAYRQYCNQTKRFLPFVL